MVKKRKANLDLLRVAACFGIVMFHHFGSKAPNHFVTLTGGFDNGTYFYDFINNVSGSVAKTSVLMDFCYGHFGNGGNLIFMLITGYFLFGREMPFPKRVRSAGKILYSILFYGVVLTIINFAALKLWYPFECFPGYKPIFTLPNWVSGENVWYLQVYGIFILVVLPLLKLFEDKLTQTTHLCLTLTLLFVHFLAYSLYLPHLWISPRILNFILCYYLGGYFAKYPLNISIRKLLAAAGIYTVIYLIYEYYWRYANAVELKPSDYSYIDVMQPFICCIIYAVLLFQIFDRISISAKSGGLLSKLSAATLGIYVFHFNMVSLSFILADTFWWNDWSRKGYFLFVIIDSIILFTIGFVIDLLRQKTYGYVEKRAECLLTAGDQTGR